MSCASFVFPAVKGIQAKREYFTSMVPLEVIPKIFQFVDEELPPEIRAQRILNRARIPEIRDYILKNQDNYVFSLTYKADPDNYKKSEADKVFNSFEFITKIDEVEKTELNTVYINDKEYKLPIRQTQMEGLTVDSKYATQKLNPNYFTIVSLYEMQQPKYSAYVYNAKASIDDIGEGYVTAISTDINRGGNIKIYKGIELGTTYSEVSDLLGSPSRQYLSDDETVLTNIYQIEDVTIQLRFSNDDLSKPNENSKVVSILLKVAR